MKRIKNIIKFRNLIPHFKFVTNIKNIKIRNELPLEEENLDVLLKEMNNINLNNLIFKQKENVIFVSGYIDIKNMIYGDYYLINKIHLSQCVSIKENLITFILFEKIRISEIISIDKYEGVINTENLTSLNNKIVDIKGITHSGINLKHEIYYLLNKSNYTPKLTQKYLKRNMVKDQLYTGMLFIDYISPLYIGNFSILYGNSNMGQKQVLNSTAINYSQKDYLVYVTYSKKEANNLKEQLDKNENTKYSIFTLSDNPSDSEYYYLPKLAISYCHHLTNKNHSVLFCFNDITTFIFKDKTISDLSKSYSTYNLIADIFEKCGQFKNHSFTALITAEKDKMNIEYELEYNKYINNIFSFTDKIIKFEPSINIMKRYIPRLYIDMSGLINLNIHTKYILSHYIQFKDLIENIISSHKTQEEAAKMRIQIDPWDNYLYHDSKIILDYVYNKNISKSNDNFLLVKFLMFIYYNDLMSNFKLDGRILSEKYINFIKKQDNEFIDKFLNQVIVNKFEPSNQEIDKFENNLEVLFDLFIDELSKNRLFTEIKEDYFNV